MKSPTMKEGVNLDVDYLLRSAIGYNQRRVEPSALERADKLSETSGKIADPAVFQPLTRLIPR